MPIDAGTNAPAPSAPRKPVTTAVRCKVCGYIMDGSKLGDLCPACGVKAAMFEPLTERFSDERRKFLELHLHPILAHYPQAFSVTILVLAVVRLLVSSTVARIASDTLFVLALALPVTLVGTFISGILDGRVRFRRLKAPYLRIKVWVGVTYLVLSAMMAGLVLMGNAKPIITALGIAIAAGLVVCTSVLGNIGSKIACSRLPG